MSNFPPSGLPLGTDEQFAADVIEIIPKLERMSSAMKGNRNILVGQKFQMDANQQILNRQNAEISKNLEVLKENEKTAHMIVKAAEDRAKEIERGVTARVAEANHKDREATKKLLEATKALWTAQEDAKKILAKAKEKDLVRA